MANKQDDKDVLRERNIDDIKRLDAAVNKLLKDNIGPLAGSTDRVELNNIYDDFSSLVRNDSYNFMRTKSNSISSFNYLSNALMGKRPTDPTDANAKKQEIESRLNMEKLFSGEGSNYAAALFVNQSSDINHICDEIESICAYLYELDEAINIFRDNIMNSHQSMSDLPFDIIFDTESGDSQEYQKIVREVIKDTGALRKLNDHIVPKAIKFGRYYVLNIPYSEIGVRMLASDDTKSVFNYTGLGNVYGGPNGVHESTEVDETYTSCMEGIDTLLDGIYEQEEVLVQNGFTTGKDDFRSIIEQNLTNLLVSDSDTPPNVTGIQESTFANMDPELQKIVDKAMKEQSKKFGVNKGQKPKKNEDMNLADATIDPTTVDSIPGCFTKLVDPRQIVPIKIFNHVLGYYYFENYDYARIGTTITDLLSNQVNFNDQNMVIDGIVGSVLRNLKYGDLLKGDNGFKSLILNCILYAERRQNPIRLKFVPAEYVTAFNVNCDEMGNGVPLPLKSLVYGRMYVSLWLFFNTAIFTKSIDTEFYYLKEGLLSQSYEDQVNDIINQFRSSNVDISQILNGDLMHSNRAINKRYFMCTGTQEQKPFDMEVISGQQIDTHDDYMEKIRKRAIGAIGMPALAVDYTDEVEFATVIKAVNLKTAARSNNLQIDLNPSITDWVRKLVKYSRPNAIPEEDLDTMECMLRPVMTQNENIAAEQLNNVIQVADNMLETVFGGQDTEVPPDLAYVKEQVRNKLIRRMSQDAPWTYLDSIMDESKIDGLLKKKEVELLQNKANNTTEA